MTRKHTKRKVWPLRDPISHAMTGARVVIEAENIPAYVAMTHLSMKALVNGEATKQDMQHLTMAHNMVAAFMKQGFAGPHAPDMDASADALDGIAKRSVLKGRILGTGPELNALNFMLQIHDQLMETASVSEYNKAVNYANGVVKSGKSQGLTFKEAA